MGASTTRNKMGASTKKVDCDDRVSHLHASHFKTVKTVHGERQKERKLVGWHVSSG